MGKRRSVVVGIAAAGLGVLVAQPLAGAAATVPRRAARAAAPNLSVPTATVPSVTVPPVSTPAATTPSVTTPKVTTPTSTTPSVTVPSVTVPSVTTPRVSTPWARPLSHHPVGEHAVGSDPVGHRPLGHRPVVGGGRSHDGAHGLRGPECRTASCADARSRGAPASVAPDATAATSGAEGHAISADGSTPSTFGDAASARAADAAAGITEHLGLNRPVRAVAPRRARVAGCAVWWPACAVAWERLIMRRSTCCRCAPVSTDRPAARQRRHAFST